MHELFTDAKLYGAELSQGELIRCFSEQIMGGISHAATSTWMARHAYVRGVRVRVRAGAEVGAGAWVGGWGLGWRLERGVGGLEAGLGLGVGVGLGLRGNGGLGLGGG